MSRYHHPLDRPWLLRDHGGLPGWGIILALLVVAGIAAYMALQLGAPAEELSWTPPDPTASATAPPLSVTSLED